MRERSRFRRPDGRGGGGAGNGGDDLELTTDRTENTKGTEGGGPGRADEGDHGFRFRNARRRPGWAAPGLGSPLRSMLRLASLTTWEIGPNTETRDRHPAARTPVPSRRDRVDGFEPRVAEGSGIPHEETYHGRVDAMDGDGPGLPVVLCRLGSGRPGVALVTRRPRAGAGRQGERGAAGADKTASQTDKPAPAADAKLDVGAFFRQPGDEPPRPFVPLHASTVDDRQRTEALRLYTAARALEDQRSFSEAVALLQQAQKLDPESVAITRRLSRIYLGALGTPDLAVEFGKKVLAVEPGDTDTLSRLVEYLQPQERPRGLRGPAQGASWPTPSSSPLGGAAAGPVRAGQALLGAADPDREGRRRLRRGDDGARRQGGQPALARRPGPDPGQRAGHGLSQLRHGLPGRQEGRPGRQGLRARAGL